MCNIYAQAQQNAFQGKSDREMNIYRRQENSRIFEDKQTINQTDRKQLLPLPPIEHTPHTSDKTVTHRQREKKREGCFFIALVWQENYLIQASFNDVEMDRQICTVYFDMFFSNTEQISPVSVTSCLFVSQTQNTISVATPTIRA